MHSGIKSVRYQSYSIISSLSSGEVHDVYPAVITSCHLPFYFLAARFSEGGSYLTWVRQWAGDEDYRSGTSRQGMTRDHLAMGRAAVAVDMLTFWTHEYSVPSLRFDLNYRHVKFPDLYCCDATAVTKWVSCPEPHTHTCTHDNSAQRCLMLVYL